MRTSLRLLIALPLGEGTVLKKGEPRGNRVACCDTVGWIWKKKYFKRGVKLKKRGGVASAESSLLAKEFFNKLGEEKFRAHGAGEG